MAWILYGLLSAAFAAPVFGKIGIANVDSTLATTVRAVFMAFLLVVASLALGKAPLLPGISHRALSFIALSGVAGALSWFFYFLALRTGPTSAVAALDRLSVVFVLILALVFLGEQFSRKSGIGALFITAGAILMAVR
ncbi:MAG: hypothetical protein A3A44_00825 [Candidatus Sungbacteria bacterium RIFCSPLOWO2_01_FULL_60_25]|uniref:EamA domain-containing protein n=1 Tax=Candidatus Sungbacteria bacterium RIFCSPLOWO2_01_FULL_60_25 TaxID=1802281 RepID=A0A1G2L9X6_9BACT|nr:MAG: hypothetical protein A3A44_00825 [Candidatus Sungbacteria bacterium RIFCSPLOWO2_01_FULL_60_25]